MLLSQQQNCAAQRLSPHATLPMHNVFFYLLAIKGTKKTEQENNISNNNSLPISHKQQQRNKNDKEIKANPIHVIDYLTRLGKDSLCSSFPSLETPKASKVSVRTNTYTFDYTDFS